MANHGLLEEPIGSTLTAKVHVLSGSAFRTGPGPLDPTNASDNWEQKAGAVLKSDSRKNRKDITGQTIDIEWHVRPGDTSVQIQHMLQEFMFETDHERESFPDRIIFASMFNDITNWEKVRKCKRNVDCKRKSRLHQDSDLVIGGSVVQGAEKLGHIVKNDHLTNLQVVNGTNSLSDNHRMLVNMILACSQNDVGFAAKKWIHYENSVKIQTSYLELNQEEVMAQTLNTDDKCVQWMNICPSMNNRFVQW